MTWGRRPQPPGPILTKRWTWPRDLQPQPMRAGWTWVTLVVARDGFLPRRPSQRLNKAGRSRQRVARDGVSAMCRSVDVERPAAVPGPDGIRRSGGRGPRGRRAPTKVDAEGPDQHGDRLVVGAQHAEGDVLGADLAGAGADGLAQRELEHLLRAAPEGDVTAPPEPSTGQPPASSRPRPGRSASWLTSCGRLVERPLAELSLDGVTDGVEVDAEGPERRSVVLAQWGPAGPAGTTPRHSRRHPS